MLPVNIFPFAVSVLSGYPMGAKVVGDMCRNDVIETREAKRLMSFCSTSGPVFMISAVGAGMLGSQTAGYIIAAAHYSGAVLNGVIYTMFLGSCKKHIRNNDRIENYDLLEELTKSIFAGFRAMALILSYIIFFMFVMDILRLTGLFELIDSESVKSLMQGCVEMTVGCSSLTDADITVNQKAVCASMIISWSGLSILGQSANMLAGTEISFSYLVLTKATHSIFAGIISLFLGMLVL